MSKFEGDTPEWKAFVRKVKYWNAKLKNLKYDDPKFDQILEELNKVKIQYEKTREKNGYGKGVDTNRD